MILVCNDFVFDNKKMSEQNISSVNFSSDTTLPSSLSREMEKSNMNKYRTETNGFGTKYTETLNFEIHLAKSGDEHTPQQDLAFTPSEYERIAAWLTSPQNHRWLTVITEQNEEALVKGYFASVKPWDYSGVCYGLVCEFSCCSPFSYSRKHCELTVDGIANTLFANDGSELYDYIYPSFRIHPSVTEEIFIHNLSDSRILENGILPPAEAASETDSNTDSDAGSNTMLSLIEKIEAYASVNSLTVTYIYDESNQFVKYICDDTAILFYMEDSYGVRNKYTAYYLEDSRQYYICQGGFFYCTVLKDLPVEIDCKNLGVYDDLKRPVLFHRIGIQDEDEIYWIRLAPGNNTFLMKGNFKLTADYLEPRKGGLI